MRNDRSGKIRGRELDSGGPVSTAGATPASGPPPSLHFLFYFLPSPNTPSLPLQRLQSGQSNSVN